jgi:hypothetical protein
MEWIRASHHSNRTDSTWKDARPGGAPDHFSLYVDQETRLCQTCSTIFCGIRELERNYAHHMTFARLEKSAEAGCRLCKIFRQLLTPNELAVLQGCASETGESDTPIYFQIARFRTTIGEDFETSIWDSIWDAGVRNIDTYRLMILYYLPLPPRSDEKPKPFIHYITLLPVKRM